MANGVSWWESRGMIRERKTTQSRCLFGSVLFVKLSPPVLSLWLSEATRRSTTINIGGLAAALRGRRRRVVRRRAGSGAAAPKPMTRQVEAVPYCDKVSRATWLLFLRCWNVTTCFTRCDFAMPSSSRPVRDGGYATSRPLGRRSGSGLFVRADS
ncbi:hypothetical protein ES707_12331 [subsurface metagenome]